MNERRRNERWFKKALHKRPGSKNRRHLSCRPKHTGEEQRWNQHRYPYLPSERKSDFVVLPYGSQTQYYQRSTPDPRDFAHLSLSSSELDDADAWESSSNIDNFPTRKASTKYTLLLVAPRTFQHLWSNLGVESMHDFPPSHHDDDGIYVEEYKCTRVIPSATLRRKKEGFKSRVYYTSNSRPCDYNQCNGTQRRIEPCVILNDIDDNPIDVDNELLVTHPLLFSNIQICSQDSPNCLNCHASNVHMSGALLEDENGYLFRAPVSFPGRPTTVDHFVSGTGFVDEMMAGIPLMSGAILPPKEAMCTSQGVLEDAIEDELENDDFEQAQQLAIMELLEAEQREAELSEIMRQMALQRNLSANSYAASRVKPDRPTVSFQPSTVKPDRPGYHFQPSIVQSGRSTHSSQSSVKLDKHTLRRRRNVEHPQNAEAKAKLDRYNKWWIDAQSRSSSTKPILDLIPFLSPSNPPNSRESDSGYDWKWAAHEFFCLAFKLEPKAVFQLDTSPRLTLKPHPSSTPNSTIQSLHKLRAQLKLEKVRWHEDKLRSLFGDEIARDERSKQVWSAVIGLKGEVERLLERGGDR
ncbi:uncharacterized protein PAC_03755 [Phialocephala subalpina]|uniref:Uncharacterized protein n=1 Tax=Phialocephala subalpina TaxID=576137 RepID=A0A1L7WM69_9HELO|nr:uncharacterized protein PAC_03755 [Phialocephala subalpina]